MSRRVLNKYISIYKERLNQKLKEYDNRKSEIKVHYNKVGDTIPLKTIFRVFNDNSIVKKLLL